MARRARWAAALLLACLALAACGKKGPVVAPERRLPQAPADLKASVEEDALVLTWRNPTARVDNSRLRDLSLLRLHRRDVAEGVEPKPALLSRGQVVGYDEVAQIRLDSPAPAVIQGGTTRWEDRKGLGVNKRYVYVVTAEDSLSRSSPPSERLVTYFLAPPRAPRGVSVTPGDHQATIRWEAPTELTDGGPATGELRFVILRGPGGEGPLAPVTPSPVSGTTYTDTGLENDTEYRWAVRAVRMDPRAQATGPASAVMAATPVDTTPPSSPRNLVAVPSPGAVRLAWNPSPEEDVALYAVYRAQGAGDFVRIATTAAVNTVYTDRDVRSGEAYRYAVTAIDRARRPNESARSSEVRVTVP